MLSLAGGMWLNDAPAALPTTKDSGTPRMGRQCGTQIRSACFEDKKSQVYPKPPLDSIKMHTGPSGTSLRQ